MVLLESLPVALSPETTIFDCRTLCQMAAVAKRMARSKVPNPRSLA